MAAERSLDAKSWEINKIQEALDAIAVPWYTREIYREYSIINSVL